ncbi:preprotein translocase, seca subunit [Heliomicrobium modesticaldum Ice1]|uniref:Protein translocase subunit SecA n=1 Tax=Heliobacterium modesticaldum (strain ATCC 51547 / Ice1) TaxID=498761 RepID=SECA_HELMI|nr:RecName: Full=Protein translocase subunit SecA [Heliomicrobium modesticaldum Ice1]ABZ83311.1 preprotein translocase, seca subunit [Heliomicrobium modesticaldum Ice1]
MFGFLKNLLDDNARDIRRLQKTVDRINSMEPEWQRLSDADLQHKTVEFRQRLENGESLDDLLPEAFATVREASRRVLGMRHFDVQLIGGMVLHQGRIAEMRTGEGKTLVATLPSYLNALTGRGVHVVTVNDYLAKRDAEWMGRIHRFLGLQVGLIIHGLDFAERREAYAADITYGTNNEFGFDYLRDNMVIQPQHMVQRELHYAIVDEVDSILIDEARTPLIISGQANKPTEKYYAVARIIPRLTKDVDYKVDEKAHSVVLTEEGVSRVEKMLGIDNLADSLDWAHHVNQGLKAHALMRRDRDYVVKDGEVIIVDEFTGRLMFGRRYSEGLHQAIEAKEGLEIQNESQTLATITLQNYFRMYDKLSGMTGTAKTEEPEFMQIYKMDVVQIPTNKPMQRKDLPDVVYRTEEGKFNAVVEEIVQSFRRGQPVLVGTVSIEKSEQLSDKLKRRGVPHQVLNAKHHEKEAEIVKNAGQRGMVTIATNMAGRGTDIILGEGVAELGGLYVIGTERHEARRIDNQLRGRSGRQGDPGQTRFYVSLEDDLMRLFGAENIQGVMDRLGMDDSMPIESGMITRAIENAQRRVEARNFDIRKHVLQYDDVMNQQREVIYDQRKKVLNGENLRDTVFDFIDTLVENMVNRFAGEEKYVENWDLPAMLAYAEETFQIAVTAEDLHEMEKEEVIAFFQEKAQERYSQREQELGLETIRELERIILLRVVDSHWMDHLDAMDHLRHGIGLRAYGQKDPLVEYKYEAYSMFQEMIASVQEEFLRYMFRVNVVVAQAEEEKQEAEAEAEAETVLKNAVENRSDDSLPKQPVKAEPRVGRNDPCPCGSGKKYKKCCGVKG